MIPSPKRNSPCSGEIQPLSRGGFASQKSGRLSFYCLGPSMNPTFRPGDLLTVAPYGRGGVRRGDVAIFRPPGEGRLIAHRIISAGADGLRTRGDNNDRQDPWTLRPEDIVGRVIGKDRWGKRRGLRGGAAGDIAGRVWRCLNMARLALFRVFRPAYRWANRTGIFRRILPFRLKSRLVAIQRPNGTEWQLTLGRTVIGRRPAGSEKWNIRRPFRPFLDLDRLT